MADFPFIRTVFLIALSLAYITEVNGCAAQYKRELRYLDYYLGIAPASEDGAILVQEDRLNHYVENALDLNCDFKKPCLWSNAGTDDLLDTQEFYLFNKTDKKTFPIQIRPGDANPDLGTLFAFAGNTTQKSQSAVLISAPIACQNSEGILTFKYWLYNAAKVEVVLLRVNNWHNHLQVINRPQIDCHFLKTLGTCRVEVERMSEPFRIGIRVFSLRDASVGSFGMISDIHYKASLCTVHDKPSIFGGVPLSQPLPKTPIITGSQINCDSNMQSCLWSTAAPAQSNNSPDLNKVDDSSLTWMIGSNIRRWEELIRSNDRAEGEFFFQYIDPMARLRLPRLRSVYVPCTQTSASLSFRYWLSAGTQAQVCTYGLDNVQLSCVYLEAADSPGPLTIDIDSADGNPFAFSFEVIQFSRSSGGLIVIDDIQFSGILCNEIISTTTISPLTLATEFDLQPFPEVGPAFSEHLNCDFETEQCAHWTNEETQFLYGYIPAAATEINSTLRGYAAIALFAETGMQAELSSQVVSCAHGGRFTVDYQCTENATLSICANERCIPQRASSGQLAVNLTSTRPFRIRLLAESHGPSLVVVKRMTTSEDGFCALESPTKLACNRLCGYRSVVLSAEDTPFRTHPSGNGAYVSLDGTSKRAILRSPNFELSGPVELRFSASLTAFGSRLYVCADEDAADDLTTCELVLGPKVERGAVEHVTVQLDHEIRQFAFVAVHDKSAQFGDTELTINNIEITDGKGSMLC